MLNGIIHGTFWDFGYKIPLWGLLNAYNMCKMYFSFFMNKDYNFFLGKKDKTSISGWTRRKSMERQRIEADKAEISNLFKKNHEELFQRKKSIS